MKRLINLYIITPIVSTWIILTATFAFADILHLDSTYLKTLPSGHELVKIGNSVYSVDHSNLKLYYGDHVVVIFELDNNSNIKDSWILRKK